jgi:hypothetical protein
MNASTAASSLGICSTAAAVRSGSSVATEMVSRCTSNPRWIGLLSAILAMTAGSFR